MFSLFEEAARDYEAEAAERRAALVRAAVKEEVFPFLAMAASEVEYGHRRALAAESLKRIAVRGGASVAEVGDVADRMYRLLAQARQGQPQARQGQPQARLERTAAMVCGNCDHASVDHSEGLSCNTCGCANFTPKSDGKEARRVTAEGGEGPFT